MTKLPKFKPNSYYDVTLNAPVMIGRFRLRVQDKHRLRGDLAETHKAAIKTAVEIKG